METKAFGQYGFQPIKPAFRLNLLSSYGRRLQPLTTLGADTYEPVAYSRHTRLLSPSCPPQNLADAAARAPLSTPVIVSSHKLVASSRPASSTTQRSMTSRSPPPTPPPRKQDHRTLDRGRDHHLTHQSYGHQRIILVKKARFCNLLCCPLVSSRS